MKINNNFDIKMAQDTSTVTLKCNNSTVNIPSTDVNHPYYANLYAQLRRVREADRDNYLNNYLETNSEFVPIIVNIMNPLNVLDEFGNILSVVDMKTKLTNVIKAMRDFFTEFEFEPNFRFLNTLALTVFNNNVSAGREYVCNYFSLIDSPYINEIKEKTKSKEFTAILKEMNVQPTAVVNSRFSIYYGSQGCGKTTMAMKEAGNRCIVCNNSMLPADLMEDFAFDEGKATFHRTALREAMEQGKSIVLDEINLLPFESLRFLQGILDNKSEFIYKGEVVTIAEGFRIIGTMNLAVNGMTYGLPEPLVDRSAVLRHFVLSDEDLLSSLM